MFESVIEYVEIEPTEDAQDDRQISMASTLTEGSEGPAQSRVSVGQAILQEEEKRTSLGQMPESTKVESRRRKTSIYQQTKAVVGIGGGVSGKFVTNETRFHEDEEEEENGL